MSDFELTASRRTDMGKGAVRRLRREGLVPGVIYGAGKEPTLMQIKSNYLRKQLENEAFFSHILSVNVDGEKTQAVVKALQRSPRGGQEVTHIDLLRVSASTELTMNVPLHFINEETSLGMKAGGVVSHLLMDVEIACMPKDLPEFIEVDLAEVGLGESVHLSGLQMPEGVRLTVDTSDADVDHTVATIQKAAELDTEPAEGEDGAEAEAGEGAAESDS